MDYLSPELNESEINSISVLGLAYMGDCVYEMLVRSYLISLGHTAALDLHHSAVSLVNAPAQNAFYEKVRDMLSPEEAEIYRRGRNAKVNSVPHRASVAEYHSATGVEALFGWLFLHGRKSRAEELFEAGMRDL